MIQKTVFMRNQSRVFYHFYKYHIKILLGDVNAKVGRENIFKPTIGNEGLHQDNNDNCIRIIKSQHKKNLVFKNTMFPHRNIHNCTWTSPDGKTHNQTDHILIDRKWHSSVLDIRSFRGADCDTNHCLVVSKVRKRLALMNKIHKSFMWRHLISGS